MVYAGDNNYNDGPIISGGGASNTLYQQYLIYSHNVFNLAIADNVKQECVNYIIVHFRLLLI